MRTKKKKPGHINKTHPSPRRTQSSPVRIHHRTSSRSRPGFFPPSVASSRHKTPQNRTTTAKNTGEQKQHPQKKGR
ncbi:hypothetical protein LX36DRAFT_216768 [Colletotrichum falcatum]|nr:hypothetical protein LX36DRAFT_216768 [Colletotrichum falcatum]